ncbi:MAG: hypothetical protein EXS36_11135 [Pedosphaera sp.]|nr:hypothetical protein [Pedosphaera sp.]
MNAAILKRLLLGALITCLWQLQLTAQEWAWAKRAGGQGAECSTGIALDAHGSVYTAGWFEGVASFDTQTLTVTGQRDAFIGKWETNGNLLWFRKAGARKRTTPPLSRLTRKGTRS